jgi:hypothetical protein
MERYIQVRQQNEQRSLLALHRPAPVLGSCASRVRHSSGMQMLLRVPSVDISRRTHNEYLPLPLDKHTLRKLQ